MGKGAFGTVYSAINLDDGRKIAVKEIDFNDEAAAAAFVLLVTVYAYRPNSPWRAGDR